MGDDLNHRGGVGRIPPQVFPQDTRVSVSAREGCCGVIPLPGEHDGGGGTEGGGDLRLPPPEHSHTVHYDQAHYRPVSGDKTKNGATCIQEDVETGRVGCGGDEDGGSGGRTD